MEAPEPAKPCEAHTRGRTRGPGRLIVGTPGQILYFSVHATNRSGGFRFDDRKATAAEVFPNSDAISKKSAARAGQRCATSAAMTRNCHSINLRFPERCKKMLQEDDDLQQEDDLQ